MHLEIPEKDTRRKVLPAPKVGGPSKNDNPSSIRYPPRLLFARKFFCIIKPTAGSKRRQQEVSEFSCCCSSSHRITRGSVNRIRRRRRLSSCVCIMEGRELAGEAGKASKRGAGISREVHFYAVRGGRTKRGPN